MIVKHDSGIGLKDLLFENEAMYIELSDCDQAKVMFCVMVFFAGYLWDI